MEASANTAEPRGFGSDGASDGSKPAQFAGPRCDTVAVSRSEWEALINAVRVCENARMRAKLARDL